MLSPSAAKYLEELNLFEAKCESSDQQLLSLYERFKTSYCGATATSSTSSIDFRIFALANITPYLVEALCRLLHRSTIERIPTADNVKNRLQSLAVGLETQPHVLVEFLGRDICLSRTAIGHIQDCLSVRPDIRLPDLLQLLYDEQAKVLNNPKGLRQVADITFLRRVRESLNPGVAKTKKLTVARPGPPPGARHPSQDGCADDIVKESMVNLRQPPRETLPAASETHKHTLVDSADTIVGSNQSVNEDESFSFAGSGRSSPVNSPESGRRAGSWFEDQGLSEMSDLLPPDSPQNQHLPPAKRKQWDPLHEQTFIPEAGDEMIQTDSIHQKPSPHDIEPARDEELKTHNAHQTPTSRDTQPDPGPGPESSKAVAVANMLKVTTKEAKPPRGDSVNSERSNGVQRGSAESRVHPKSQQASLDTLIAGLHCLDDGHMLNDAVVNILIGTLACDSVGVIDSLQLTSPFKPSPGLQMRLLAMRETNILVMPCFHRQSNHWRLFIHLRGSDSIAELDSLNLPNKQGYNTVIPMVARIRGPPGPTRVEKIRCAQQGNNIDCGVFTVAFAMKIAPATTFPPPGLEDQVDVPVLRQRYKKMLLTSTLASPPAALLAFRPLRRLQPGPHNHLLGSDINVINFQRRLWDKCRHLRVIRGFDDNRIASLQLQSELIQASAICCTAGLVDMHHWHATAIDEATRAATARRTLSVVTQMRDQMADLLTKCSGTQNRYLSAQQQVALRMMGSAIGTAINEFPDHTQSSAQAPTQSLEWSLWTKCVVWWLTARRATNLCHKLQKQWHANHAQLVDASRDEAEAMGIMHRNI
ncbi:uncharacterized protein CLUP02_18359 [Colletotrichum lupini]|uniref:Ubiquitin-like protease family profile domain-containing protein n=1 Tax=Colletotrichum lupini TaxID=145971 RepID=A0A9Q8SGG5_9PEZI|nr:uncharacterized protein CLUP02_18359 [Colletotrichum lupini]UQC76844.1 hypothetical protein CLUP02_18359 [Colletotrichum lupini]